MNPNQLRIPRATEQSLTSVVFKFQECESDRIGQLMIIIPHKLLQALLPSSYVADDEDSHEHVGFLTYD